MRVALEVENGTGTGRHVVVVPLGGLSLDERDELERHGTDKEPLWDYFLPAFDGIERVYTANVPRVEMVHNAIDAWRRHRAAQLEHESRIAGARLARTMIELCHGHITHRT
jgi:hypothetical protein